MADFYPLISKAVSNLESNTAEARQELFERARVILVQQMRLREPPATEPELMAERFALEDAIRKIEAESSSDQYCPPKGISEAHGADSALKVFCATAEPTGLSYNFHWTPARPSKDSANVGRNCSNGALPSWRDVAAAACRLRLVVVLRQFWSGRYPLAVSFWGFYVAGTLIYAIATGAVSGILMGFFHMRRLGFDEGPNILMFGYQLFAAVGVWRSASATPLRWRPGDPHDIRKAMWPCGLELRSYL